MIRPDPVVEIDSRAVCGISGGPLFAQADAAVAAIDAAVQEGVSRTRRSTTTTSGSTLRPVATSSPSSTGKQRQLPAEAAPALEADPGPAVLRARVWLL